MKKNIVWGILFLALSFTAINAQQNRYGFRIGLNYSDLDFDNNTSIPGFNSDNDARIGFTAGFFGQYYLSEKFSIQPELQYSAQGERSTVRGISTGVVGENSEDRLKVNVLQLPVLLNYEIKKFSVSIGPQIGIRIFEWERTNDYETLQFSAVGGIGYNVTNNIILNLRASYGLSDAIKTDNNSDFKATAVNHYLQFTVAYRI